MSRQRSVAVLFLTVNASDATSRKFTLSGGTKRLSTGGIVCCVNTTSALQLPPTLVQQSTFAFSSQVLALLQNHC